MRTKVSLNLIPILFQCHEADTAELPSKGEEDIQEGHIPAAEGGRSQSFLSRISGSIRRASFKRRSLKASKKSTSDDLPSVSWFRVLSINPRRWLLIFTLGILGAVVQGVIFPTFAYFFGQVLRVFTLPFNQVLGAIHLWAGLFLVLGLVSGIANFVKVPTVSTMQP